MSDLNLNFLLDIWADLKARRLAPVAVALLVGLVAMPVLLLDGGEATPAAAPLPILSAGTADGAEVEVADELAERGSSLDSYRSHDPFDGPTPPKVIEGDGAASAPADVLADAKATGDAAAALDSLGLDESAAPDGSSGSSGSSGSDLGRSTGDDPERVRVVRQRPQRYAYQLDLEFGRPGRETRHEDVARLSFLPSPKLPALLFMGVSEDERSAVFFVHPGLTHQGEGDCVPSPKECNFLELGLHREHYLATNDREFRIELLKVNRVKLSEQRKQREKARNASRSSRSSGDREGRVSDEPDEDSQAEEDDESGDAGALGEYDWPWLADGLG